MGKFSLLFLSFCILVSCRTQDIIRPGDTIEIAYEKAQNLYSQENWTEAVRAFETVVSIGRGSELGQLAQYYLAESYYNNRQYLLASSEYERYSSFYPNSPRREETQFKLALCYYQLSPRYNLDQSYTRRAIDQLRLYIGRYPNSERVEEAASYMDELRNKLARKYYEGADFYMRTNRFNSASVYYDILLETYPGTDWAERALAKQVEAYILYADNSVPARQAERYQKAVESYERYLQLFPRGENRETVEELYDQAMTSLQEINGEQTDSVTVQTNE